MAVPDTLPEVLTVEEFERLEDPPGYRLELVGGMLEREPQPGALHGLVTMNALRALDTHCRAHRSGMVFVEAGYVLDPLGLVRRPDVSLLLAAHLPEGDLPEGMWRRPPVLYPRTHTVVVHRSDGVVLRHGHEDEIDGGDVLPGFRASVRSFFARE